MKKIKDLKYLRRITKAIYLAIDEINKELSIKPQLKKKAETVLFGDESSLDSLGLVNLIVEVEQNIANEFGIDITLADDRAVGRKGNPFKTVLSLSSYIYLLLKEECGEKK